MLPCQVMFSCGMKGLSLFKSVMAKHLDSGSIKSSENLTAVMSTYIHGQKETSADSSFWILWKSCKKTLHPCAVFKGSRGLFWLCSFQGLWKSHRNPRTIFRALRSPTWHVCHGFTIRALVPPKQCVIQQKGAKETNYGSEGYKPEWQRECRLKRQANPRQSLEFCDLFF